MFGWWCFYTQYTFFSLAHEQGCYDSNSNYIILLLLFFFSEYLSSVIMISNWSSCFKHCDLKWMFFLSDWKHSPKPKWFTIVTLIWVTIAAVRKHGFRSLVCKCLFPYDPGWNWTHIRYSTCETHVTLTDDLADLENYSCLVTLQITQYKWFTRLGF